VTCLLKEAVGKHNMTPVAVQERYSIDKLVDLRITAQPTILQLCIFLYGSSMGEGVAEQANPSRAKKGDEIDLLAVANPSGTSFKF
jgi:hypothetical protein